MRYTKERRQIQRLIKKWRPVLGMNTWSIEIVFLEKTGKFKASAWCEAVPKYEEARITFDLPRMSRYYIGFLAIEEVVMHEMVHAIAWNSTEIEVTRIARSILRAFDAGAHSRTAKKRLFR